MVSPVPLIASGPRLGGGGPTKRNRNSTTNNASHGAGAPPGIPRAPGNPQVPTALVSPGQAIAYGEQLAAARQTYLAQLASNRLGVRTAVLQGRTALAQNVATRNAGLSAQENTAAGSGRLGGSYDLSQRAGVVSTAAQNAVAIQEQVAQARQQGKLGGITAEGQYATAEANVASEQAAAQAEAQAAAYREGLFDPSTAAYKAIYQAVLARLAAQGHDRGVQRRYGAPQQFQGGTSQPTYIPGMLSGAYPT